MCLEIRFESKNILVSRVSVNQTPVCNIFARIYFDTYLFYKWAINSVGQSASLTRRKSQVRVLHRPPFFYAAGVSGWRFFCNKQEKARAKTKAHSGR